MAPTRANGGDLPAEILDIIARMSDDSAALRSTCSRWYRIATADTDALERRTALQRGRGILKYLTEFTVTAHKLYLKAPREAWIVPRPPVDNVLLEAVPQGGIPQVIKWYADWAPIQFLVSSDRSGGDHSYWLLQEEFSELVLRRQCPSYFENWNVWSLKYEVRFDGLNGEECVCAALIEAPVDWGEEDSPRPPRVFRKGHPMRQMVRWGGETWGQTYQRA